MAIEIQGIRQEKALRARVSARVAAALAALHVAPVSAKVTFFDAGHFALETHCDEIAAAIRDFLPGSR